MLRIKAKSFFSLKYDIIKNNIIGELRIPFTRLIPSLRYGDIVFNIEKIFYNIVVPLKGEQRIGFSASEYILMQGDKRIASAEFPPLWSEEQFKIEWNDKFITFSLQGEKTLVDINSTLLGSFYKNHDQKREYIIDIGEKLPVELQVFSYFAYKKYTEVTLGI